MFGSDFSKNLKDKFNSLFSISGHASTDSRDCQDLSGREIDEENGFLLSACTSTSTDVNRVLYYLPEEILALILSYVEVNDLTWKCRLVCQSWKCIIETLALRYKTERECGSNLKNAIINEEKVRSALPWQVYYGILKGIFGRNLLRNNCGQDKFKYWDILSNGGDKFIVEATPQGCDLLPECGDFDGCKSCFVTSYHSNTKEQLINLRKEGLVPAIMDKYQPPITVSEWYSGRFDCGCIYELKVTLLNERKQKVTEFLRREKIEQWEGRDWKLMQHTFRDYGPGVRYISFYHGGMDTQFWAGHFGSKFSGGTVKAFYLVPNAS